MTLKKASFFYSIESIFALIATIIVLSDMSIAPIAGDIRIPKLYSTPAAKGIATTL